LSYGLWQRVYGGDPGILGKTIRLDDEPYIVIGVVRPDFHSVHIFGVQPDLWIPLALAGRENEAEARVGGLRPARGRHEPVGSASRDEHGGGAFGA